MVDLLGKMKGENGKYDAEAIEQFSRFMGDLYINHPSELFDGDKLTDKFYSASLERYYHNKGIDKFMPYIDDGWKNHYGDTERKYLELVSTYPDHPDSKDERIQWIRDYFDAGGPTGELFDAILCDDSDGFSNIEVFLDNPDIYSKLSNGQKDFINIYKHYGSGIDNKISSSIREGRADIVRGTLTVDSLVNEILNEIPLNAKKIDLLGDCRDAASRLLDSNEKSLAKFCANYKGYKGYWDVLSSMSMVNNHNLADYFDANGPTDKMKDEILFRKASFLYDHPELQEGLTNAKKSAVEFCGKYDFSSAAMHNYGITADNLADYFDANGPTGKLQKELLFNDIYILCDNPTFQTSLSDTEKSMVEFCDKYDLNNWAMNGYGVTADNLTDYFDANGPTDKLKKEIFTDTTSLFFMHPELQEGLTDAEKNMVEFCGRYCYNDSEYMSQCYGITVDNLADYFDANGPTEKLQKELLFNDIHLLYGHPTFQTSLSDAEKSMVKFCEKYSFNNGDLERLGLTEDNLIEYFDVDGPTPKLKEKVLFSNVSSLYDYPELQEGLSDEEIGFVKFCHERHHDNQYMSRRYGITADNLADYFDANGPTIKLQKGLLFNDTDFLCQHPEVNPDRKSVV